MHTRQGVAEPARSQHTPAQLPFFAAQDELGTPYSLAHALREGPNRSRITVGPRWLESLFRLFVSVTSRRRMDRLDVVWVGLAILAALASVVALAALLVGER